MQGKRGANDNQMRQPQRNIFMVLNPIAGHADAGAIRQDLAAFCQENGWAYQVYETTGQEDLAEITRAACERGANLVAAAGGDGTVAGVVNGLVHSKVPLAVIPTGTGNGLARAMKIPMQVKEAFGLLAGGYAIQEIDAMRAGGKFYVLNVSAGISATSMQATRPEDKQRVGILAYAGTMVRDFSQKEASLFDLELDGRQMRVRAVEVLVSNGKILTEPPFLFGERESFSDGRLEVNILTADKAVEIVRLAWELLIDPEKPKSKLHDFSVRKSIRLSAVGEAMLVQGDGEVIGETPVEVHLVPRAIRVLVPRLEGL